MGRPCRQIGTDFARLGAKDSDIVPLLHRKRGVTFFTLDLDFFKASLCHPAYALIWLDVRADDAAHTTRRFLKHPQFNTRVKRMGVVARAHPAGIDFWQRKPATLQRVRWIHTPA
jgi:hypothetical protein